MKMLTGFWLMGALVALWVVSDIARSTMADRRREDRPQVTPLGVAMVAAACVGALLWPAGLAGLAIYHRNTRTDERI